MTHVVTASHPITLDGGRPAAPGEKVRVKTSDPHVAGLIASGQLTERPKKAAAKPRKKTKADVPESDIKENA